MSYKIYSFNELCEKIGSESKSEYYYRGERRLHNGPLWPSMYRGTHYTHTEKFPSEIQRRRGWGSYFALRTMFFKDEKYKNYQIVRLRELLRTIEAHTRNALGYCLSEALFQQAGWQSEGLDVTSDFRIAMFFATHRYDSKSSKYYVDKSDKNERLLYRYKFANEDWSFYRLNKINFYNTPQLFPSQRILDLFEECDSIEEFEESINHYRDAIKWDSIDFSLDDIQGQRPFELIKLPKQWKKKSRIVQQKASLIFPDTFNISDYYNANGNYIYLSDGSIADDRHGIFVEDLSKMPNCEVYHFKLNKNDDLQILEIQDSQIYIKDDISHLFLNGWMKSLFQNEFGTIPIVLSGNTGLGGIDASFNFDPLRFDDGSRFNR